MKNATTNSAAGKDAPPKGANAARSKSKTQSADESRQNESREKESREKESREKKSGEKESGEKESGEKESGEKESTRDGSRKGHSGKDQSRMEKNWLEWCVFGISLFLVVGILGYLLFLEFKPSSKEFIYQVTFGDIRKVHGKYRVPIKVKNESNQSAKDVAIEVTSGKNESEKAELQLDYLPRHSVREAVVYFDNEPKNLQGHINSINLP